MEKMDKKGFNFKAFTSFLLFAAFLVIVISGIMLYISPPGRIANWTNWQMLGLTKTQWTSFHIVFIVLFLVAGIFHIFYFNWKPLWSYITRKAEKGLHHKKEFWWAIVISVVLLIGTWARIPPVISIVDLGDYITESWETKEERPPEPHAELLTLKEFSDKIKQPVDTVVSTLKKKGYTPEGADQTLKDIAEKYNIAPNDLYNLFKEKAEEAGVVGTGGGYGKMKFDKLTEELGLDIEDAKRKLADAGIVKVKDSQTLREIADANDKTPVEVFNVLSPEKAAEH